MFFFKKVVFLLANVNAEMFSRKKPKYKDEELIAMIQQGPESDRFREAAGYLYLSLKEKAIRALLKKNNNVRILDDAKEIYHRTFVDFLDNLRLGKFRGEGKLSAYFGSILNYTKIKWLKEQQNLTDLPETLKDNVSNTDGELSDITDEEKRLRLERVLQQLSEKCRKILLWDKNDYSSEELANRLGLASQNVLYVTRARCWRQFIAILDN